MNPLTSQAVLPVGRDTPEGKVRLLGTSFFISDTKLATAGHVTGPSDKGLCVITNRVKSLNDYQDTSNYRLEECRRVRLFKYDPFRDISIIEFEDGGVDGPFEVELGGTDYIPTGTTVVSLGFPHMDTYRLILTQQTNIVGARMLLENNNLKTKHVVLNTQTRPGQSGGPVFSSDGRRIHAMIIGGYKPAGGWATFNGIDPQTLHQTTHAVSAEYIKEMI